MLLYYVLVLSIHNAVMLYHTTSKSSNIVANHYYLTSGLSIFKSNDDPENYAIFYLINNGY